MSGSPAWDGWSLMVITHPQPACGRPLEEVVAECVHAGAPAIQFRDKAADGRALASTAGRLHAITKSAGATLIVNDRLDVALAAGADGVHLGPDDLPVSAARDIAPPDFIIGYSTDDPDEARRAAAAGASYLGVGAVFGTRSKPGLADEAIGPDRVRLVREASRLPCLGIGGLTVQNAREVLETGAGIAVLSTVMSASAPAAVVRELLRIAGGGGGCRR
ncbi:MAG: thiamine phosphate synthase [Gemmatimonadales bacterium]|nr:thiamine phosphate synthase [Gemmatimonadales bacterium]MYG49410.1 thiamine phosphate synthase [Gemmatimonadales bacterium]MYK02235.1 thiamine phosphate synthase [Candidatus Palauibacter ramosifaciens]